MVSVSSCLEIIAFGIEGENVIYGS
jgi:hypothetical protein